MGLGLELRMGLTSSTLIPQPSSVIIIIIYYLSKIKKCMLEFFSKPRGIFKAKIYNHWMVPPPLSDPSQRKMDSKWPEKGLK